MGQTYSIKCKLFIPVAYMDITVGYTIPSAGREITDKERKELFVDAMFLL